MNKEIQAPEHGKMYKHFKGDIYRVIERPFDSATGHHIEIDGYRGIPVIWYQCVSSTDQTKIGKVFTRRLSEFVELIEVDGANKPRFTKLESEAPAKKKWQKPEVWVIPKH